MYESYNSSVGTRLRELTTILVNHTEPGLKRLKS